MDMKIASYFIRGNFLYMQVNSMLAYFYTQNRKEEQNLNAKVIAIAMQKGGVGKTTTCANLGIGLAQDGKKVLIVDSDPQGSRPSAWDCHSPTISPTTLATA